MLKDGSVQRLRHITLLFLAPTGALGSQMFVHLSVRAVQSCLELPFYSLWLFRALDHIIREHTRALSCLLLPFDSHIKFYIHSYFEIISLISSILEMDNLLVFGVDNIDIPNHQGYKLYTSKTLKTDIWEEIFPEYQMRKGS